MDKASFDILLGEWTGAGEMGVGTHTGIITEHLNIESTDIADCVSYIRKSSIDFGGRVVLHNEMGYITPSVTNLLLSRGSYIIMAWEKSITGYEQTEGSADSKNMIRKIIFNGTAEMDWDNVMDVNQGGQWVTHTAKTVFTRIA